MPPVEKSHPEDGRPVESMEAAAEKLQKEILAEEDPTPVDHTEASRTAAIWADGSRGADNAPAVVLARAYQDYEKRLRKPKVGGYPLEPFFVEDVGETGCKQCGHGKTFWIAGPEDQQVGGISYFDRDEAEAHARVLNDAYRAGFRSATVAGLHE
jgi:hypothetical protein